MASTLEITQQRQRVLWYYHGLCSCGQEILPPIFCKAYPGDRAYIKQHIFRLIEEDHKAISQKPLTDAKKEKLYKKQFYEFQRQMLEGQTPLEDITLLHRLLRNNRICNLAADDNAWTDKSQRLEYGIQFIKEERDRLSHESLELSEQEYTERMLNLMDVVEGMLLEAGRRFNEDFSQLSSSICHKLEVLQETHIIDNLDPSNEDHWHKLKHIEKLFREREEREALAEMMQEITSEYEDLCQVQPAPWLLRHGHQAKLPEIFVSMELEQDDVMHNMGVRNVIVSHDQLLTVKRPDGTDPTVTVLHGEGGAGKSTLMKLLMYHWLKKTDEIKGLSSVPLLLFTECRDATKESLADLLQHYCPNTTSSYGPDRLKEIVMSQSLIIIVDGYDEINPSSKKLLKEILAYSGDHIRVFVTTRPINARELVMVVPETMNKMILKVLGIEEKNLLLFVSKLLQVFLDNNQKVQEEADKLMKQVLGMTEDMRIILHNPLNLSLIVLMWVESPEKINSLTTMTALFATFRELTTGKVIERLEMKGMKRSVAEEMYQLFLGHFDELAYNTHRRREFELKSETAKELKRKIQDMDLPDEAQEDFLSAYFITKLSRQQFKFVRVYSFRHRLEQDYSCASHLATVLTKPEAQMTLTQLVTQGHEGIPYLTHEPSVITFLTGILHMKNVLPTYAEEIMDLVQTGAGFNDELTVDVLLHHLAECNIEASMLQAVQARLDHYHSEGIRTWEITTGRHLCSLLPLLTSNTVKTLVLTITENPAILTHLHPVLECAVLNSIKIKLLLDYNRYMYQEKGTTDDKVLQVFSGSSMLETFEGCISKTGVLLLPESLRSVRLWDVNMEVIAHLNTRLPSLHNLDYLMVSFDNLRCVPDPDTVTRLPFHGQTLGLWLRIKLMDEQAGRLGAWLGNIWPDTPPPNDQVVIQCSGLTVAGIEIFLENLGATLPNVQRNKRRSRSPPEAGTSNKIMKLENNEGGTRSGESSDTRYGESSDTSGGESSDTRGGESSDTRGGESSDTRGGESSDTRGGESSDTRGGKSEEKFGPVRLRSLVMYTDIAVSWEDTKRLYNVARPHGVGRFYVT